MNRLYYGDNLDVLRQSVADETVDLVYLDPPFNSNANYNVLFKSPKGEAVRAQADVFEDTWHWGDAAELAFHEVMAAGGEAAGLLRALRSFFGETDMMAYIANMAVRLEELRRILKPTGTIYLHCDPTASHYLKIMMDGIFGARQFINEISWRRTTAKADYAQGARHFPRVRDVLLRYQKDASQAYIFNQPFVPYDPEYVRKKYSHTDPDGRQYRLDNLTGPGGAAKGNPNYEVMGVRRYWRYSEERMKHLIADGRVVQTRPGSVPQYKRYLDEMPGVPVGDDWDDIRPINSQARERLGFATQKPLKLLHRIIETSTNPGDVVLDPFCGCGTAVHAAEQLGRQWIGIDVTHVAIQIIEGRLKAELPRCEYKVDGRPADLEAARDLARRDKHEFQLWVADRVGAAPEAIKKGADRGIDGYVWFLRSQSEADFAILSVKGGENIGVGMVRDLRGTMEREGAGAGLLVCLAKPTRDMTSEAASAGVFETFLGKFPRLQIITVEDLFAGKRPNLPPTYDFATLLTLPRAIGKPRKKKPTQVRDQLALLLPLVNKRIEELSEVTPDDITVPERKAAAG